MTLYHSYRQQVDAPKHAAKRASVEGRAARGMTWVNRIGASGAVMLLAAAVFASTLYLHHAADFDRQSKENFAAAQQVVAALDTTRAAALTNNASAYWTQSGLGFGDRPYMNGSVWHIDLASNTAGLTTISRGGFDPALLVNLHVPGAEVGFDSNGRLRNGAIVIRIDSPDPGKAFLIDVAADGSITTKSVGN